MFDSLLRVFTYAFLIYIIFYNANSLNVLIIFLTLLRPLKQLRSVPMRNLTAFFAIFMLLAIACNKNGGVSTNTIKYSLDSSSVTICPDSANVGQMIGGPSCRLNVNRQNRYLNGLPSTISISLDSNCDFTSGSIPYSTSNFRCVISDNGNDAHYHPETDWVYPDGDPFDPLNVPKGNLTLLLTYRNGGHLKGTVTGTIYGGPVGYLRLAKLTCDFDVVVTVR